MREARPVIALDFPSFEAVKQFLALFPAGESLYLKVGMELYYATGPEIVSYLKGYLQFGFTIIEALLRFLKQK